MNLIIIMELITLFSTVDIAQSMDSTTTGQKAENRQKMDRFVDTDGDGICDHRAQGLGFKRGTRGERKMKETSHTKSKEALNESAKSEAGKQHRGRRQ